jgi:Xaa-Pro dipeptidase
MVIDPQAYRLRQQRIFHYLSEKQTEAAVIVDLEGLRNQSLRYLCGQPADALLFLFARGESMLVPWDVPLARSLATADELIPYERYERSLYTCIKSIVQERRVRRIDLSAALPYPLVQALLGALPETAIECRPGGIDKSINVLRMIKDSGEIEALRGACGITNELIGAVPDFLARQRNVSELELALFLEAEARRRGAEGMGFDTLAASTRRSFAIHCFPNFTTESIALQGLSILDFGVRFTGYTSDVTLTLSRAPLTSRQEVMVEAVQEAYDLALTLCKPGVDSVVVGERVQDYFENRGFHMPHSLGHGIGLDAHEAPLFRRTDSVGGVENRQPLEPGMVFTVEPGLYDPEAGGVRLENDLLCTEEGTEVLTSARILDL